MRMSTAADALEPVSLSNELVPLQSAYPSRGSNPVASQPERVVPAP
jgi:hypothetical protein